RRERAEERVLLVTMSCEDLTIVTHVSLPTIRRWLFPIVADLSLILFVATLALWVRSYWSADYVEYHKISNRPSKSGWEFVSNSGILFVQRFENYGFVDRGAIPQGPMSFRTQRASRVAFPGSSFGFGIELSESRP